MNKFTLYDSSVKTNRTRKTKRWLSLLTFCMMIFAGQMSFAQVTGSTCGNPLLVTSTPFSGSGNTSTYGNNYGNSDVPPTAPDAVTTGTGAVNYLGNGDDVVYSYTAGSNGSISINTTHTGGTGWNSLWVFTGCPFTSTVGYHTAISGTTRSVSNLPVVAGTTYYIVISNWDPGAVDFTIDITGTQAADPPTCLQPDNLGTNNITHILAELSWTETGTATTWDIEWGLSGFTPTETPTVAGVTSNPYTLTGLTENTQYQYYVRSDCGGGDVSYWSGPFTFQTTADCSGSLLDIISTTEGSVCNIETSATLQATATGTGDEIYW